MFARDPDFDPRTDAIVRVEAGRLRSKLSSYYENEGRNDTVVIRIPVGGYTPEFLSREPLKGGSSETTAFTDDKGAASAGPTFLVPLWRVAVAGSFLTFLVTLAFVLDANQSAWPQERSENLSSPRIVVLPFDTYSDSFDIGRIADRLTEKVTLELVRIGDLRVVPSVSAFSYRRERLSVQELRQELRADVALLARLMESDGPMMVEAVLIDTARHEKFWIDDSLSGNDVDEIARRIAHSVNEEALSVPTTP